MRSIMLHVEDEGMEARPEAALNLTRQFDAHLTCIQASPGEFAMSGDFYGAMAAEMAVDYTMRRPRVRDSFGQRLEARKDALDLGSKQGSRHG